MSTAALYVGLSTFDYLVDVVDEDVLLRLTPDFARLGPLRDARGDRDQPRERSRRRLRVAVLRTGQRHRRGSGHGVRELLLAPYWSTKLGKTEFVAHQLSARGGVLRVRLEGDRVKLLGQAVTIFRGELLV